MKRRRLYYALFVMAVATIVSAVVVSCKKETSSDMLGNKNESAQGFNPREIDDMNAYLKGFKQKMQSTAKGEDEALPLDEAAWHLSSLANYEFGNANVEFSDLRFDTIYATVRLTGDEVLLSDLYTAYNMISSDIDSYLQSLNLENANIRFVNVTISKDGIVRAILYITYGWHIWYFEDEYNLLLNCFEYFTETNGYYANGLGRSELQRALNCMESHPTSPPSALQRVYYTLSRMVTYKYDENIDPYESPSFLDSRLFASSSLNPDIAENICYYFGSYLALGYDNTVGNETVVGWEVYYDTTYYQSINIGYHDLTVSYGIEHGVIEDPHIGN